MINKYKYKISNFKHSKILNQFLKSRIFIKNFTFIISIMTLIFLIFALFIYRQSARILANEFKASSQYQLEATAQAIDNHIMDMRYIIATIDTNSMAKAFFRHTNPELLYDEFYIRMQETLNTYINSHSSIDSIYLYSEISDSFLTKTGHIKRASFSDTNWMKHMKSDSTALQIFFRAKNDTYPYLLCLMKHLKLDNHNAVIILNLNLGKLSYLTEVKKDAYQEIFLVSDSGEILFRNRQESLSEPLNAVPELSNFQNTADTFSVLIENASDPYTYSQVHSSEYPWCYVSVTHLQDYTSQLSSSRALLVALFSALFFAIILIAFLFSMRSVKPIQNLLILLKNPQETLSHEQYNDDEIQYIADQITSYIQQNEALSDELNARLNLLNETKLLALQSQINPHFLFNTLNMIHIQESQELGYNHNIPKLTLSLSRLLRYAIESTDLVTLKTELEFTKMYIDILRNRYGDKPNVMYNIDSSTYHTKVPKMIIQPIIENAVFHGLAEHMNSDSTLILSCYLQEEMCVLSIRDNGVGMKSEILEQLKESLKENVPLKNSIGIKNVVTRMNLLYGNDFSINIESQEAQGTIFTLRFPFLQ